MPLQFRRGTEAQRTSGTFVPLAGEPIFVTDEKKLYIGDGITAGGVSALAGANIEELSDVELNSENIRDIVGYSIASNVVTVQTANSHGFVDGQQVTIAFTTNTSLNGTYTVSTTLLPNEFTFAKTASNASFTADVGQAYEPTTDGSVLTWSEADGKWINALPVTSIAALEDVVITSLANGDTLVYDSTAQKWENGQAVTSLDSLTDVVITSPANGQTLTYNSATSSWVNTASSGLSTRTTAAGTTASIANNASANLTITGFKSYMLMAVQTSAAAWVTIYTSTAARTADASRLISSDPVPGSGVIAEVITTAAATQKITPGVLGFNDETTPTTDIYLKVVNQSGASAALTVTLTLLRLEA